MILPADQAAPFADRSGTLELKVEVRTAVPIHTESLLLIPGQTLSRARAMLRVHRVELKHDSLLIQLGHTMPLPTYKASISPNPPTLRVPGWVTREAYHEIAGVEPKAAFGRLSSTGGGLRRIRDLVTAFPSPESLKYRVHLPELWVPDPRIAGPPLKPERAEIWKNQESTLLSQGLRLEEVTIHSLDGSGHSQARSDGMIANLEGRISAQVGGVK